MRPDKAGQKTVRPAVPESRSQRLLLGEHSLNITQYRSNQVKIKVVYVVIFLVIEARLKLVT